MTALRNRMIEDMKIRNLALNTQTSYLQQVSLFARHFGKSPARGKMLPRSARFRPALKSDSATWQMPAHFVAS